MGFRANCQDVAYRDLQDCIAERDLYAKKQLEDKRAQLKIRRLPDDVNTKISQMKREAMSLKEKAAALDNDTEARLKDALEKEAAAAMVDYEAFVKEEERKAQAAAPKATS